jgi:hypothetical protein
VKPPALLHGWQVRVAGHVMCNVYVLDDLHLASEIHRALGLNSGTQVRLSLDQETLEPTSGATCHPDGITHRRFALRRLAPKMDCQP